MSSLSQQGGGNTATRPSIAGRAGSRGTSGSERNTARVVGVLYLAGMALGIGGNILIQSILTTADPLRAIAAGSLLLAVGAVCWLVTAAGDLAHGVLMFGILRRHSEHSAVGYLAARIADGVIVAVMIDEPSGGIFYGGQVAAPVFSSVMGQTLRLMEVPYDAPLPTLPAAGETIIAIVREGN